MARVRKVSTYGAVRGIRTNLRGLLELRLAGASYLHVECVEYGRLVQNDRGLVTVVLLE